MATKAFTRADVNMAKLLVLVADDLGEPLDPAYRALAESEPEAAHRAPESLRSEARLLDVHVPMSRQDVSAEREPVTHIDDDEEHFVRLSEEQPARGHEQGEGAQH